MEPGPGVKIDKKHPGRFDEYLMGVAQFRQPTVNPISVRARERAPKTSEGGTRTKFECAPPTSETPRLACVDEDPELL
jgi:hypothetical protein